MDGKFVMLDFEEYLDEAEEKGIKVQEWINDEKSEVEYRVDLETCDEEQYNFIAEVAGLSTEELDGYTYLIFWN